MLQGPRVCLRAIEREDIPLIHGFSNDLAVELAGGGDPPYPQALARAYADFDRSTAEGGRDGSSFVIEADGKVIGQCALFGRDAIAQTAELGITIGDRAYWARGYGREALTLLLEYGFRLLNLRRIHLKVHATNARALRAYRAVGFVEEGRLRQHVWSDGAYDDLVLMGVLREEWSGSAGLP